jgi:hypothetical protein
MIPSGPDAGPEMIMWQGQRLTWFLPSMRARLNQHTSAATGHTERTARIWRKFD